MQVGTTTVESNPNAIYLESRYFWIAYSGAVCFLHLMCSCVPFITATTGWLLTLNVHNIGNFIVFHYLRGSPFGCSDQGENRQLTHWEQINHGKQWTNTRKFLIIFPCILFLMCQHYCDYSSDVLFQSVPSFLLQFIPKQPFMHAKRLFGINKY
ncbi:hypothetical protein ACHWQZ_G019143 [Mnemiopsis leidyi]